MVMFVISTLLPKDSEVFKVSVVAKDTQYFTFFENTFLPI
jgi:hypothetical protein